MCSLSFTTSPEFGSFHFQNSLFNANMHRTINRPFHLEHEHLHMGRWRYLIDMNWCWQCKFVDRNMWKQNSGGEKEVKKKISRENGREREKNMKNKRKKIISEQHTTEYFVHYNSKKAYNIDTFSRPLFQLWGYTYYTLCINQFAKAPNFPLLRENSMNS